MKVRAGSIYTVPLVFLARPLSSLKSVGAQIPAPQVRMVWQDFVKGPHGAKRLTNFPETIAKTKSLEGVPKTSVDYRRRWEYWANRHGSCGSASMDGSIASLAAFQSQVKPTVGVLELRPTPTQQ